MTLSIRSSTVHVPAPLLPELTCHCRPTIWVGVETAEFAGLLNAVNRVVYVMALVVALVSVAAG